MAKKPARRSRVPPQKAPRKKPAPAEAPAPPPEVGPFDAHFFESQFKNLLRPRGLPASKLAPQPYLVTLVLGDGMVALDIARIEELSEQWALIVVDETNGLPGASGQSRFVFVPYAAIARVEVSGSENRTTAIGFHRQPAERKKRGVRKQTVRKKVTRKKKVARKAPKTTRRA